MATENSIQIRCSRCALKFRDKATRVRDGYSRQCPSCERMIYFIEGSPNKDIHTAMREAQRVRKALTDEAAQKAAARMAQAQALAKAQAQAEAEGDETASSYGNRPAMERRTMQRRTQSSGRSH